MLGDNELKCLKRELKAWESMFERKHTRKPNKDDVNNAPEEIRETYTKYNQLKRGSKDGKKRDIQPKDKEAMEDEVFGKSLNKNMTPVPDNFRSARIKMSPTEYKPIKLCHGQKPKKAVPSQLKTNFLENNSQDVKLIENENQSNCLVAVKDSAISDNLGFSISSAKKDILDKPGMMLGKSTLTKRMKRRSVLASNWLEKNQSEVTDSSSTGLDSFLDASSQYSDGELGKLNPSRLEFTGDFDSGNVKQTENFPKANGFNDKNVSVKKRASLAGDDTSLEPNANKVLQRTSFGSTKKSGQKSSSVDSKLTSSSNERVLCDIETTRGADLLTTTGINGSSGSTSSSVNADSLPLGKAAKSRPNASSSYIPLCNNDVDLLTMSGSMKSQNEKDSSTAKRKRNKKAETFSTSEDVERFSEDGIQGKPTKKRKISGGSYGEGNMKQVENGDMEETCPSGGEGDDGCPDSCNNSQKNGIKRSSGLVSENFRALNMKVRRYSRRGHGTNYAAYKRKMWKQKQQANEQGDSKKNHWKKRKSDNRGSGNRRISSTTSSNCFKCGEDGHWVKDCPRNKPANVQVPAENWSEPVKAPADLEIGDEQWLATEEKLTCLVSDRLPRPQNTPCEAPPTIEPLYQPENDQPCSTPKEVYDALNKLGFDSFRCGQEQAIMQILCGLSTLVVLSTGAGKSLCYQLPAYMYSKRSPCITLVISPLVSLMEDQVVGLPFGLHGVSLNTNMTKQQRQKAVDQICSGKAAVVLVSPEALVGGSSAVGCLPHPSNLPPIAFACIDEAHCVSEWSHNFRPSYLRVCKVLRERFGVRCFLGLTATATRSTALSVCEHLGIIHRPEAIVRGATIPDNLNLSVSCDLDRDRAILELLQGARFSGCDSIIIYCTRREQTERLATYLRTCLQKNPMNTSSCIPVENDVEEIEKENKEKKRGKKRKTKSSQSGKKSMSWHAECYHAGLSAAQRKKVQKKFMSGELRIVVATVAFGMGLDKADVRAVIHYNMPKSFESYVQEIGRAGRDGLPSHCHVFIDPEGKDVRELRRHAYASTIDRNTIKKLVQQIFLPCDCKKLDANMREKRDKELSLVKTGTSIDCSDDGASKAFDEIDWLVGEDDIIDHVIELEKQSSDHDSKELGINVEDVGETVAREITPKSDVNITEDKIGRKNTVIDEVVRQDDVTNDDVTTKSVVTNIDKVKKKGTADDDVTKNDVLGDDVTNNESEVMNQKTGESQLHSRVCGGHEVAIPIEKAVQELDMKEEAIETLLCYLELHAKRWAQIMKSVRSTCTLKFYGGPAHLHYVAQRVPIVTAAVAYARRRGEFERNTSSLTFPVVEIVDKMGWDLEPVRRELYGLQWNEGLKLANETGLTAGHSGIIVEFKDLAFHVRAPGDLSGDERDEVCDFLEDRIMAQERSQLAQLHGVWSTFNTRAHSNCWQSAEECDKNVDGELKSIIKAYFESKNDPTKTEMLALISARKNSEFIQSVIPVEEPVNWDGVSRDVRSFISSHGDLELSGRAIARVFHGIDSPCFPAYVWGRERRFWRRHLNVDFNLLRKCATKELVKFR